MDLIVNSIMMSANEGTAEITLRAGTSREATVYIEFKVECYHVVTKCGERSSEVNKAIEGFMVDYFGSVEAAY